MIENNTNNVEHWHPHKSIITSRVVD